MQLVPNSDLCTVLHRQSRRLSYIGVVHPLRFVRADLTDDARLEVARKGTVQPVAEEVEHAVGVTKSGAQRHAACERPGEAQLNPAIDRCRIHATDLDAPIVAPASNSLPFEKEEQLVR